MTQRVLSSSTYLVVSLTSAPADHYTGTPLHWTGGLAK